MIHPITFGRYSKIDKICNQFPSRDFLEFALFCFKDLLIVTKNPIIEKCFLNYKNPYLVDQELRLWYPMNEIDNYCRNASFHLLNLVNLPFHFSPAGIIIDIAKAKTIYHQTDYLYYYRTFAKNWLSQWIDKSNPLVHFVDDLVFFDYIQDNNIEIFDHGKFCLQGFEEDEFCNVGQIINSPKVNLILAIFKHVLTRKT